MMKFLKYAPFVFAAALCVTTIASADPGNGEGIGQGHGKGNPHVAPEIDPGLAFSALSLVGGVLLVQRSRRSK